MFIGTSNQLGKFEFGLTTSLFDVMPAVLLGRIGTIIIAILWMRLFPELLHITKLGHKTNTSASISKYAQKPEYLNTPIDQ